MKKNNIESSMMGDAGSARSSLPSEWLAMTATYQQFLAAFQQEQDQFEQALTWVEPLMVENRNLTAELRSLEDELSQVRCQFQAQHRELDRQRELHRELNHQISLIEEEMHRFRDQYTEVLRQNSMLIYLYVTSYRLHETLDRFNVLTAIQEIVMDLLGSEQIAIFEVNSTNSALNLVASSGIDGSELHRIPIGVGLIGATALSGEVYLASRELQPAALAGEKNLSACIPLKFNDRVVGVIAIFQLFSQKETLGVTDEELFEVLSSHAATALYCSRLHPPVSSNR